MTQSRLAFASVSTLSLLLVVLGCDGDVTPADGGTDAGPAEDLLRADCDPIVPEFCALPFPSDHWLAVDSTTPTGHRLALGETTMPRSLARRRLPIGTEPFNERDGWSVNASILAYLGGATATGLPSHVDLDGSLAADSRTVLMVAETGERVPHWAEIDQSVGMETAPRAFIIRPAVVLDHNTRYLVAIRGVVDAGGATLPAPETFAALRDGTPSDAPTVEARRASIDAVLDDLDGHGVGRADLQLAWDFTTCSQENDTAWMIAARDRAFAAIGDDGPAFTIDRIDEYTEEMNAHIARRVQGHMTVPNFLRDDPELGELSRLNLDSEGLPVADGTTDYPFVVMIPRSASPTNRIRPLQYGHGLLGDRYQADSGFRNEWANANRLMPFGVDWVGMSVDDVPAVIRSLANGTAQDFRTVPERLVQGVINSLVAMRLMLRGLGEHEMLQVDGQSVVDTSAGFYTGDSQGGIFGATYMALTQDVTRGILGVPGQPYALLLNRSVDFDPYLVFLRQAFTDGIDIQIVIQALQLLWDRAEPGSFSSHIAADMFPDTPVHTVILQPAIGDHQVTTLGAHIMARAIGAVTIAPETRPVWGITEEAPPYMGSAMVEFESGVVEPVTNMPPRDGDDPHSAPRRNPRALAQALHFFETGEIIHTCDGPCDPQ